MVCKGSLEQATDYHEFDLETAIVNNLHEFLMQLGRGYAFVARQQHPSGCWTDGYISACMMKLDGEESFCLVEHSSGKEKHTRKKAVM